MLPSDGEVPYRYESWYQNDYLKNEDVLPPGEQRGYRSVSGATKHQFLTNKAVPKDCKKKPH